jgi:type IV pilus assembly protein PilF
MRRDWRRYAMGSALLVLLAACSGGTTKPSDDPKAGSHSAMSSKGQANLSLAQSYLSANNLELALDRANRALRSDPNSSDVQIVLGMIRERLGERTLAGEHYSRAATLSPNSGHVLNVWGVWLCQNATPQQADEVFARAIKDPFYAARDQALFNAGKCAMQAGQLDKAAGYLRLGLEQSPESPPLLERMAQVQYQRRDYLSARAFLQRREALGKMSAELLELAANIEDGAGDARAAQRYRARLREQFPDYSPSTVQGAN